MGKEKRVNSSELIVQATTGEQVDLPTKDFTGVAHTLVYRPHEGFANYAILSAKLEKGIVQSVQISAPYAAVEAMIRLEILNERKLEEMRKRYPAGYRHI